ncbi:MAG: tetratricopeptide repeat protein [Thermodesulfovibrionales bacterium]|jgi:tetratricopeptide (TPR) repeat protein
MMLTAVSCFIFFGCATLGNGEKTKQANAHYQLGVSYLNENNIQPAFIEFQKALELNPNDKEVLNAMGIIYLLKIEDYPRAIVYFQRALKIDKNFSEASNNLGRAYEMTGRFYDAIESYKTAVSNPRYRNIQNAFTNLGKAYYRVKNYQDAINSYQDAIRRFSDFYFPYYGLALAYNAMGKYSDAAAVLTKALELDPEYKGDREKARKYMEERKLVVRGEDEKDIEDLLEIMNY